MQKEKIAIVNVNSYGRDFPEYIQYLESEIGPVQKFSFDQDVSSEELANQLRGYQYIILGTHPTLKAKFFDLDPDVKLVTRHGLGYNNINLEVAKKHGTWYICLKGNQDQHVVCSCRNYDCVVASRSTEHMFGYRAECVHSRTYRADESFQKIGLNGVVYSCWYV